MKSWLLRMLRTSLLGARLNSSGRQYTTCHDYIARSADLLKGGCEGLRPEAICRTYYALHASILPSISRSDRPTDPDRRRWAGCRPQSTGGARGRRRRMSTVIAPRSRPTSPRPSGALGASLCPPTSTASISASRPPITRRQSAVVEALSRSPNSGQSGRPR